MVVMVVSPAPDATVGMIELLPTPGGTRVLPRLLQYTMITGHDQPDYIDKIHSCNISVFNLF